MLWCFKMWLCIEKLLLTPKKNSKLNMQTIFVLHVHTVVYLRFPSSPERVVSLMTLSLKRVLCDVSRHIDTSQIISEHFAGWTGKTIDACRSSGNKQNLDPSCQTRKSAARFCQSGSKECIALWKSFLNSTSKEETKNISPPKPQQKMDLCRGCICS